MLYHMNKFQSHAIRLGKIVFPLAINPAKYGTGIYLRGRLFFFLSFLDRLTSRNLVLETILSNPLSKSNVYQLQLSLQKI